MIKKLSKYALPVGICLGVIGLVLLVLSIGWIVFDDNLFHWFTGIEDSTASNLGQFIGGFVGVFLSGAGFFLIYSTFIEQREFNNTISKLSNKQQFETTFFNMLDTYRKLVEMIEGDVWILDDDSKAVTKAAKGYDYFSKSHNQLINNPLNNAFIAYIENNIDIPEIKTCKENDVDIRNWGNSIYGKQYNLGWFMPLNLSIEFYAALYEYYYVVNDGRLGHYFRFIYNIIKYCIDERHAYKDEKKYIDILQAQISNAEMGLLFYNALSKYAKTGDGVQRFFNWLDYYDFFENIDLRSLHQIEHHDYYSTLFKFLTKEEKEYKVRSHPKPELILP